MLRIIRRSGKVLWQRRSLSSQSNNSASISGITKGQIPSGQEDLYVLKSSVDKVDDFSSNNFSEGDTFGTETTDIPVLDVGNTVEAVDNVATAVKDISSLGIKPSGLFMQLLENIHVHLEVPYWGAVVTTALMIRVTVLPLALNSMKTGQRMVKMQPELAELNSKYMSEGSVPKEKAQDYALEYRALTEKHGVHPLRAFLLPMFQIPISICAFMGIREMDQYYPDYATGGAYWFEHLAQSDPTYILPVLNSVTFLMIVEMVSLIYNL